MPGGRPILDVLFNTAPGAIQLSAPDVGLPAEALTEGAIQAGRWLSRGKKVYDVGPLALAGAKKIGHGIKGLLHRKHKKNLKNQAHAASKGGAALGKLIGKGKQYLGGLGGGGIGMDMGGGKLRGFGGHHRRMRATNPKALRRAIRRVYAAEKIYRKLFSVTHRQAPGHVHARRPKRHGGRFAA